MWRVRGVGVGLWQGRVGVCGWRRGVCGEAEVRVFWDLNRCGCGGAEVEEVRITPNIVHALRSSGVSGPVSIQAYGSSRALSHQRFLHSLLATGVDLHHVPGAMKDLSNHLLLDLLLWVKENPPPAHMLLISDDKEYSSIMHKLHMRGYNVLLAHPEGDISPDLLSAASKVWVWESMMKGTKSVGRTCDSGFLPKIVNPLHSKCLSTRSFNLHESQLSSNQDAQAELDARRDHFFHDSKIKSQNIPKKVVKQVVDVIRLRPNGFTLGAFRRQLGRSNVVLDKDFYGHKDLLSFLLAVPKLKASLVWTSEKTRTYLFTEDFSTDVDNDSLKMLQVEEEAKHHPGTRIQSVSAFQQLNCKLVKKEHSKGCITEKVTGNAANSPGILADRKNAFSITWRKVLSKLSFMRKSLQFVGIRAARTEMASSETPLAYKGIESNFKDKHVDIAEFVGPANNRTPKEEGKQKTSAQMVASKETPKEGEFKMPERAMHDDVKVCTTSDCVQENRETQGEVPEFRGKNGAERHFPKGESKSKLQGYQGEVQNAVDTMSSFLQVGKCMALKAALKNTGLQNQLSEDILTHLWNEGRRSLITREATMDDVLKFLMESDLKGLKREELVQLAEILHSSIVKQLQNDGDCNTGAKAIDNVSLIGALRVTFDEFDNENGTGGLGPKLKEERAQVLLSVSSEEQFSHKQNPKVFKAKEDGSMLSPGDKMDVYTADIIVKDLKELLLESKCGVRLAALKPLFRKRYGYELNHKALGHRYLASLVSSLGNFDLLRTNDHDHLIVYSLSHQDQNDARSVDTLL